MRAVLLLPFVLAIACGQAFAADLRLETLPYDLTLSTPGDAQVSGGNLVLKAKKGTDLYSPAKGAPVATAPRVTFVPPAGDFIFSARTHAEFAAKYDGPGLVIWNGDAYWAKLLFERIDDTTNVVSSTFSTPVSDNSYHTRTAASVSDVWLKIVRMGNSVFFYTSLDGKDWQVLRDFAIDPSKALSIGFFGQSPVGEEFTAVFSEVRFEARTIKSYWQGE